MVPFGEKWESLLASFKDDASLGKQKYDGGKRAAKAAQEARKLEKADAMFVTYCAELEDFAPRWLSLFRVLHAGVARPESVAVERHSAIGDVERTDAVSVTGYISSSIEAVDTTSTNEALACCCNQLGH